MMSAVFIKTVLVVSVASFLAALLLYGNKWANELYQKSTKIGVVKTWKNKGRFLTAQYLITLAEVIFFSWVFSIITIHTGTDWLSSGLYFAFFLCIIRIIPRMLDTFMMINYPVRLLVLELINGCLVSLIMGIGISYFLY